jgi:hypothetical protein
MWDSDILYADVSSNGEQFLFRPFFFVRNQKYERGGRFKVQINILFYGDNHEPLHTGRWSLVL